MNASRPDFVETAEQETPRKGRTASQELLDETLTALRAEAESVSALAWQALATELPADENPALYPLADALFRQMAIVQRAVDIALALDAGEGREIPPLDWEKSGDYRAAAIEALLLVGEESAARAAERIGADRRSRCRFFQKLS